MPIKWQRNKQQEKFYKYYNKRDESFFINNNKNSTILEGDYYEQYFKRCVG